ncbi:MAG: transcriptional regulator SlyA [Pseudomonadota bacterium]|nr:transcriptional regulator SlyA [Pseudomonadota bacterium]
MPETIGFKLSRLPRLWRAILDERLAPLDLTQTRWVTLYHLWQMGDGQPQCDLARAIGVEAPSLVRTLDQLSDQGLIERRPCPNDRRTKRVYLTESAMPMLEQIVSIADQARTEILEGISPQEVATFEDLLNRIERNAQRLQTRSPGGDC